MADTPASLVERVQVLLPGILIAGIMALASQFVSEHYGAPAMLLALLFGISLNFLGDTKAKPGIDFGSRQILRIGVALLGVRISADVLTLLGWPVIALVVGAVAATIAFGLLSSRLFGFRYRFAFLSAGAVAICGASAAMAIAAILPKDERSEERLIFTVVGVTLLSTVAMILYPVLSAALGFDDRVTGIFIGATVHDVAQVVGAGYSVSDEAGNIATLVKLLRVILLAPVVVLGVLAIRALVAAEAGAKERPPIVPVFVIGFIVLAGLSTAGAIPAPVIDWTARASGWLLLTAIASVGMKTRPQEVMQVGLPAALFLVAQTVFLAVIITLGLRALSL